MDYLYMSAYSMKKYISKLVLVVLLAILLNPVISQGKTCTHTNLSRKYVFITSLKRIKGDAGFQTAIASVKIIDKKTGKFIQILHTDSGFFFADAFSKCNHVRSYSTGINKLKVPEDNDFGDLVIADLNFDGKEDFALKKDSGGNGGPVYDFYMQAKDGKFYLDSFLTNQMEFFPDIKKSKRTLVTLVHANAYQMGEQTYRLDSKTNTWKMIRHRFLTVH